jgi:hypothetical protein
VSGHGNPYANGKPSTTSRGYGAQHQRERERWARVVDAGYAVCVECGKPIAPGADWHLAHDHSSPTPRYAGAAHPGCNVAERNRRHAGRAPAPRRQGEPAARARSPYPADKPEAGVFYGPPSDGGRVRRWSRAWFDWRSDPAYRHVERERV